MKVKSNRLIVIVCLLVVAIVAIAMLALRSKAAFEAQATIDDITPASIDSRTDYDTPLTLTFTGNLSFERALFDNVVWTNNLPIYGVRIFGLDQGGVTV